MNRFIVVLLAFAQIGAPLRPSLCSHPDDHSGPACEQASGPAVMSALTVPNSCDACDMPDCQNMLACTAVTAAVATSPLSACVSRIVKAVCETPEASATDLLTAQIPPPPRA